MSVFVIFFIRRSGLESESVHMKKYSFSNSLKRCTSEHHYPLNNVQRGNVTPCFAHFLVHFEALNNVQREGCNILICTFLVHYYLGPKSCTEWRGCNILFRTFFVHYWVVNNVQRWGEGVDATPRE